MLSGAAAANRSPAAGEEATPPQIQQLLTLLADPKIQVWLKQQNETRSAAASALDAAEESPSHYLDARIGAIREHLLALAHTVPDVPHQFARGAARVSAELGEHGRAEVLLLLLVFVGLGTGVEWLFRKATETIRDRLDGLPLETVKSRVHLVAIRFGFAVGMVVAFALGSVGPFLALDWPPLLREMLFGLLIAFLAVRIANVVGLFLLAPRYDRFRLIPMDMVAARFWYRRLVVFVGWFAFGYVLVGLLDTLGWSLAGRQLVAYVLGLGLLAIALEAVWRRPARLDESIAASSPVTRRFGHGALSAVVILLVADLLWHAMKTAIDRKLAECTDLGLPNTDEARRRARLRTLLPIFRNILFVVVIVFAVMMALAALGVQIGPLVAGLGVLGVAIGFGAQSLVRDVIAGIFYLLDDAFRVGEYIQSGNYKGTVESFSFRSVRLRHQRGAVYTVPFSLLGAVQNQSRDWVIDKLTVGITYDSDIERARKLIKQIGLDLAKNPEFAPLILQPLKMQGVDAFGDFAVQIRMKMMTLPGENFVVRRQALFRIKKAFDANGVKFAFPTVQLAGEGEPSAPATAAVAQQALQLVR